MSSYTSNISNRESYLLLLVLLVLVLMPRRRHSRRHLRSLVLTGCYYKLVQVTVLKVLADDGGIILILFMMRPAFAAGST